MEKKALFDTNGNEALHSSFAHYLPDPIMLLIRFPSRSPLPGCGTGSRLVPKRDAKVAQPLSLCQSFAGAACPSHARCGRGGTRPCWRLTTLRTGLNPSLQGKGFARGLCMGSPGSRHSSFPTDYEGSAIFILLRCGSRGTLALQDVWVACPFQLIRLSSNPGMPFAAM
jgi:hypothetical protein